MRTTGILIRKRLTWLFLLCAAAFVGLIVRLAWIQFVQGDYLQQKALEVRMRDIPVEAKRGAIYDRNGQELVTSVSSDSVYTIPYQVKNPGETADLLAPLLEMDRDRLYKILTRKSCYEWVKRKVSPEAAARIRDLKPGGIHLVEESRRFYPHETLAPHLLGFTGVDNQGLMGIEKTYDDVLRGQPGRILVEHDAAGRNVPDPIHRYYPPEQGNSLVLTLDSNIQYFVERELDKVVARYSPKLAVAIVMDPRTGEVLAMGNRPTFNSNNWSDVPRNVWDRNPSIWYNYEPGSTFKIVTTSAAVNEKVVRPADRFFDPGFVKVADRRIKCWKGGGHGSQSFEEVVMNSCNPGFVDVGLRVGRDNFYKYLKAFGFGDKTGIDLAGEARGIVIDEKKATNLNIATMSIGQSIAVTPIQLLSAACAVANGGTVYKPQLVREIRDSKGKAVKTVSPEAIRSALSKETSDQVKGLLENVVARGTGINAFVEGYRVAGKTGTAQVVGESGGYVSGRYVASFVGFAPVEDPQVAVLVMIAEPQGGVYYGGVVAAPVFQSIMRDTLHYLGIPENPGIIKPPDPAAWYETPRVKVKVPNVVNYPVDEAIRILRSEGLSFQTRGGGAIVYSQVPRGGSDAMSDVSVLLELDPPPSGQGSEGVTVPNLSGLTEKEVRDVLESMGLILEPSGTGLVSSQDPGPGGKVTGGTAIKVEFKPPGRESTAIPEAVPGGAFRYMIMD
ncbi:MAG: stage V sporulation protein D [Actinobacteria bacterium]|nr:stage V sporulation protein D [Actinomycetota bacterium]